MIPIPPLFIKIDPTTLPNIPGVLIIGKTNGTLVAYSLLARDCFEQHVDESNWNVWPVYFHAGKDSGEIFENLREKYQGTSYQGAFSVPL